MNPALSSSRPLAALTWDWRAVIGNVLLLSAGLVLFFPSPLLPLGFFSILLWYLWRWITRTSPVPKTPVNLFVLIFLLMLAVGLRIAPEPEFSTTTVGHALLGITLFFAIQDWADSSSALWRVLEVTVLFGLAFAFASPFVTSGGWGKLFDVSVISARFHPLLAEPSNPNIVAGMFAPMVPLAGALIASQRPVGRIIGAVALLPLIVMLVLLQSRGALFAAVMGLVVYATFYWKWVLPLVPLTLLVGLWFNNVNGAPVPIQFFVERNINYAPLNPELREPIWAQSLAQFERSPLVGIGTNELYINREPNSATPLLVHLHAHNLWLQIGLDTGIIGLAAFVGLFGDALLNAWRAYQHRFERALAIGLLASLASIVVHSMLDTIYWGMKPAALLWVVLGVAIALGTLERQRQPFRTESYTPNVI